MTIYLVFACTPDLPSSEPNRSVTDTELPEMPSAPPPRRVVINEVQSANHGGIRDEDGDAADWIELFNADEVPVDLTGWSLTDSDDAGQWMLPAITLPPGGFQLVFASGKDRVDPVLHTNFELKSTGERVRLYDRSDRMADQVEPAQMYADQSHGRKPDGTGPLGYFLEPTPGAPNLTESRPAFAAVPAVEPPPGHHPSGASVEIFADDGATIHVAWGGAVPTQDDPPYTGPLRVGVDTDAVVVRARAWQAGLWPSPIATATYLVSEPGALPVVSLVVDPPDLWDLETGIYTFGTDFDPEVPYEGANFWEDWERPIHLAAWEPTGAAAFSVDAGVSVHGGWSRAHEQRGLMVQMRGGYGDAAIEHEVFPGLEVTSFSRLLLRASGNDWHGCSPQHCSLGAHLRDGLMHRLAAGAGLDTMGYRPAVTYLNGAYWGIYNLREQPGADWIAAHHGHEDIDLLELHGLVIRGDDHHYQSTLAWLRDHDLSDPANYAHAQTLIDTDAFATYLVFQIFYDNTDWPGNNIKYWRPRTPDGRWRWLLYDTDFGLGRWFRSPSADTLSFALATDGPSWPNPPWSTELFRLLIRSPTFTETFVNRYADYLNTLLSTDVTRSTLHELADAIAGDMPDHAARWGSWTDGVTTHTLPDDAWADEIGWIDEWLGERPAHARDHLVTNFGLGGTWTLTLDADPPGSGTFALTAVEVDGPFVGTYFRGVPVTVTAVPGPGATFAGWSGADLPHDPSVALEPGAEALSLVARFE